MAAVGGTAEVMEHVANGDYEMVGTFNGNPLAMAACKAMLTEVATPAAYERLEKLRLRAVGGLSARSRATGSMPRSYPSARRAAWCSPPEPVRNFRDFLGVRDSFSHAHWLFQHNGGVFLPPWGKIEQWLMSVQHDEADIDRFINNFAAFAAAVRCAASLCRPTVLAWHSTPDDRFVTSRSCASAPAEATIDGSFSQT